LEEESDDSENDEILNFENDGIPNFENDISQMISMVNISSNNIIRSSVKKEKKKRDHSEVRGGKKKIYEVGLQLLSRWDQLIESMQPNSDSTSLHMDRKRCSILKVMGELHSIPRVTIKDDFHDFTI
jgi:hypothetical protein